MLPPKKLLIALQPMLLLVDPLPSYSDSQKLWAILYEREN